MFLNRSIVGATIILLSGCGGGSSSPSSPTVPTVAPTVAATVTPTTAPTTAPVQHAYLLNNNGGSIGKYALPLSSGEQPLFTAGAFGNPWDLAVDGAGDVADALFNNITIYLAPFSALSTPAASINLQIPQSVAQLAFNGGKLYAGVYLGTVDVLSPPFSSMSTPSIITPTGITNIRGITFDPSGTLYISNLTGAGSTTPSNVFALAPPYTGTPIVTPTVAGSFYGKLAASATQLFVTQNAGGIGAVNVYQLPLTASSVPAFSIITGLSAPRDLAIDATGKLYVGNSTSNAVTVFTPPFSASSAPTATLNLGQSFSLEGVAIGP